jgi:hypothetical protein
VACKSLKVGRRMGRPVQQPVPREGLRSSTMVRLYLFKRCAGKDSPANHSLRFCEAKWADNSSDDAFTGNGVMS